MQPMHVITRLLLHANTPHTPSRHSYVPRKISGRCQQVSQDVPAGVISRYDPEGGALTHVACGQSQGSEWGGTEGAPYLGPRP